MMKIIPALYVTKRDVLMLLLHVSLLPILQCVANS